MYTKSRSRFILILAMVALFIISAITAFSLEQVNYINGSVLSCNSAATQNIQLSGAVKVMRSNDNGCNFKLFGIIPIGKASEAAEKKYVELGGYPIGIAIKSNGLYITSKVSVVTKDGAVCPVADCDIKSGDILTQIDGEDVDSIEEIPQLLDDKQEITIKVRRLNQTREFVISPALDALSGKNKLGLLLQDQIEGIGTMTYTDGNDFYALGHTIKDINGENVTAKGGKIYNANISGYVRGKRGKAGELNGSFVTINNSLGEILANNNYGLYGRLENSAETQKIELGSKSDVQPGTAYIYSTIEGETPQKYEVQIIKANNQNSPAEKSMVIRVVDKRLLDTTGGIVQGMSGSPIVQNDRLVGAITHVFTSDPTKGYGVYIDWMKP